jgi:hypothetical protein
MKNIVKLIVIIAVVAVIGLSFAACPNEEEADLGDNGVQKTLVITGVTSSLSGDVLVSVSSTATPAASMQAVGSGTVSGGNISFPLRKASNESVRWTGTGDLYIVLVFENHNNAKYFYSGGGKYALRYSFSEATATIPFSDFYAY